MVLIFLSSCPKISFSLRGLLVTKSYLFNWVFSIFFLCFYLNSKLSYVLKCGSLIIFLIICIFGYNMSVNPLTFCHLFNYPTIIIFNFVYTYVNSISLLFFIAISFQLIIFNPRTNYANKTRSYFSVFFYYFKNAPKL